MLFFILSVACGACVGPAKNSFPAEVGEARRSVYLVSHGWHTGIVLKRAEVPRAIWPEADDFSGAEYLEVGWGDRDYYQAREFDAWLGVKAIFWPTPSVLHIVGFNDAVESYFPTSDIIRVELSARGFERLCGYIHDSYARDAAGQTIRLGPSLYGDGRFYLSREKFHLFNTCNVWTARGLRAAGLPVTPFFSLTTGQVMSQARKLGTRIQTGESK
ncbi:MAG: DUF2459 domain-containing protein [Burkholderiales bacterium]